MKSKLEIAVAALERISAGDVMSGQAEYTHGDTVVAYQRICREALAAIQAQPDAAVGEWVSVAERLPEPSELVAVFAPWCENDWPGSVNIGLDCIDPNDDDHASWEAHNNHYEHYCCVAKGMEDCTGPSEKAPYTHWHALAAPPPVKAQGSDAA